MGWLCNHTYLFKGHLADRRNQGGSIRLIAEVLATLLAEAYPAPHKIAVSTRHEIGNIREVWKLGQIVTAKRAALARLAAD
ncbi:hypothetical protein Pen02_79800 [Plantactinospora endophytica]|uniref:Uncharacterized protein n=1 Tax=Plantactinospora endophytica TaxID=673535 RepID=A0ABQ4EED1_9ACTN|nr:hypothetical protein Pen02_79800 [Plantactinospora endophytica]